MPVFNHMPMGEDGLQEVYSWVDSYVKNNPANCINRYIVTQSFWRF